MSATGTVNVGVSSSIVNIGTSQIGTVNVGIAGSTIALKAPTSVTTLNATGTSTAMQVGENLTNGSLALANGTSFTGNISIGGGSSTRTGALNIGTSGAGTITVGNTTAPLELKGSTITFTGTTTLDTTSVATLNAITAAGGIDIGANATSGGVQLANGVSFTGYIGIGSGSTTRTGLINIGTGGSGAISIGNTTSPVTLVGSTISLSGTTNVTTLNMANPTGTLDIGNNVTSGIVTIASSSSYTGAIYIGSGANRVGNAEFATSGTGSVIIGASTSPLTLRGSTTTLSSPLTLGTPPSTTAHLGGNVQPTVTYTANATVNVANAGTTNAYFQGSFAFNSIGIYIISFYQAGLVTTPVNAVIGLYSNTGVAVSAPYVTTTSGTAPNIVAFAASSFVYNVTALTTFNFYINVFSGSMFTNSGSSSVTFTRLA